MTRIVKKEAPAHGLNVGFPRAKLAYLQSDTIEIKKGWRPEDWHGCKIQACSNSNPDASGCPASCNPDFEAGFDACLEELEKL